MKKFLILVALLFFANSCFGACPTMNEYKSKLQFYQYKSLNMLSNDNFTTEQAEALQKEMFGYIDSIIPGCVAYFQATKVPDCGRLSVMSASYMTLDKNKQPSAKAQIYKILQNLPESCSPEIYATKMMVK